MKKLLQAIIVTTALIGPQNAQAEEDLFEDASTRYGVPKHLLIAIARQESSLNPLCINIEGTDYYPKNEIQALDYIQRAQAGKRSFDIGIMQINSYWHKAWNLSAEDLLDPRTNIDIGARILAEEIKKHGFNWKAIGKYHSPNTEKGRIYAWRVFSRMGGINGKTNFATRATAQKNNVDLYDGSGIHRSGGIQPKGRTITFRLRQKSDNGDKNTEQ